MLGTMTSTRSNPFQRPPAQDKTHLRNGKSRAQKTIDHLHKLLALHNELSADEIEQVRQEEFWIPSRQAILAMLEPHVRQADRIAIVFVDYKMLHGTNAPSLQDIASALNVSKNTVTFWVGTLVAEGQAVRIKGQFWLTDSGLQHPLVRRIFRE